MFYTHRKLTIKNRKVLKALSHSFLISWRCFLKKLVSDYFIKNNLLCKREKKYIFVMKQNSSQKSNGPSLRSKTYSSMVLFPATGALVPLAVIL